MTSCMKQVLFVLAVSFVLCQDFGYSASVSNKTSTTTSDATANATTLPVSTPSNGTTSEPANGTSSTPVRIDVIPGLKGEHSGMLERSLYVAVGISALVAIYFIVRWMKTGGRRKAKKYGVVHGTEEMEVLPLEKHTDEDDEDIALFDVKDSKRPK